MVDKGSTTYIEYDELLERTLHCDHRVLHNLFVPFKMLHQQDTQYIY